MRLVVKRVLRCEVGRRILLNIVIVPRQLRKNVQLARFLLVRNFLVGKSYKEMFTIVNMVYMLPQEIEVWYIIPAVRKELAKLLTKDYGFSYERAGKALGISKAAVSQYLSDKRANKVCLDVKTKREVGKSAGLISENEKIAVGEIQRILRFMKENKCSCKVCKQYNKEVLGYCNCEWDY